MKTILIYRLGSLGDTVVALPCFHRIAESFPEARRIVLTNQPVSSAAPRLADVLGGSGLVHETIEYEVGLRSVRDLLDLRKRLSGLHIDAAIYLAAPRGRAVVYRDLAFFRLCGITRIFGVPTSQDLQRNRIDPVTGEEEYECERLARCLAGLGPIDLRAAGSWDLRLTAAEHRRADAVLAPLAGRPFLAFNMGGKQVQNDWGHANWRELLTDLSETFLEVGFVFVGGGQDAPRAADIGSGIAHQSLNLCGGLSPRETAAVLGRARLFVGHDSGPLHLAAASQARCIGLFKAQSKPHKWYPFGVGNRVFRFEQPATADLVATLRAAVEDELRATHQRYGSAFDR